MIGWEISAFYGIQPRTPLHMLKPGYAIKAHNVDLVHGTIKPWREYKVLSKVPSTSLKLYAFGCCYFTWNECVNVTEWVPNCRRLYITGRASYPEVALIGDNCTLTYQRLGVYAPNNAPQVSPSPIAEKSRLTENRAYIYTFMNNLGEESAPSFVSEEIEIDDGMQATVSGFETPSPEYNITTICLYRRATGFATGLEKEEDVVTDYALVGMYPISTTQIIDTLKLRQLGRMITTEEVKEPPQNLKNITLINDAALLAGAYENKIRFSEGHRPWSWPLKQEITLDDTVVGLGYLQGSLFVATDGNPYIIDASSGCDSIDCRTTLKLPYPFPMIACSSGKGSVITPLGMIYVSTDGLVLLSKGDNPKLITEPVYSVDDWRYLRPETMRLAYYRGAVYCVSDVVSFIFWIDGQTYAGIENQRLTTFSDMPKDMVLSRNGELLFLEDGEVRQWNASDTLRAYEWVSEPINAMFKFSLSRFHMILVDYSVDFTWITPLSEWNRRIGGPFYGDFALPLRGRHRDYTVKLEGIGEVERLRMSTSLEEVGTFG